MQKWLMNAAAEDRKYFTGRWIALESRSFQTDDFGTNGTTPDNLTKLTLLKFDKSVSYDTTLLISSVSPLSCLEFLRYFLQ